MGRQDLPVFAAVDSLGGNDFMPGAEPGGRAHIMRSAVFLLLQLLLAVGVPALIGWRAPRRWLLPGLLLWLLAPLLVLLVVAGVESARAPPGSVELGKLFYGLALIGSFFAVPWILACLVGFGLGSALRRSPAPTPPIEPAASAPPAEPVRSDPQSPAPLGLTPRLLPPSGWHAAHVGFDHDGFVLDGLDLWGLAWRDEGAPAVMLPHPAHPDQIHRFTVYTVHDAHRATRFAAAELSNGVWGFYRWILPADAAEAMSADGSLRYAHSYGEAMGGRYDAAAPMAALFEAATGERLFDGAGWYSSRIVPQPEGSLLLLLEQNGRQSIFRLDPAGASFHDLIRPGAVRPLRELGAAAAEAHRLSVDTTNAYSGRRIAPDGSMLVELDAVEWANSHWVHSPHVIEVASGRTLIDLRGSDWDAAIAFPRDRAVRLALRAYRSGVALTAEIDLDSGRYAILGVRGTIAEGPILNLREALDGQARAMTAQLPSARPNIRPRATIRSYAVALMILAGALLLIAGTAFWARRHSPEPVHKLDRIPAMPRAM